jgi:hypothetical protein
MRLFRSITGSKLTAFQAVSFQHPCWILEEWWHWDDAIGASVQFSVDGHSFFLALQNGGCRLFWEMEGDKVEIAKLPDQDRQQFTDHLLVAIGNVVEPTTLP